MRTPWSHRALIPWFVVAALLGALPAGAAAAGGPTRLSLLTVCGGASPSPAELRLRSELELLLDGFDIVNVDPGRSDFLALTADEQVDVIRQATSNAADTSPVLWMVCDVSERPVVWLLVTDGGVPFVRMLGGDSIDEIALIVRELIETAPPPPAEREPLSDEPTTEEPPPRDRPASAPVPAVTVGVLSAIELGGGLVGHRGRSFLWGGGIALDARLALGFFGRVTLLGKLGPRSEEGEFLIAGQRFEMRLELGYLWEIGRFALGPLVGLAPFLSFVDFAMEGGYHQRDQWWLVRYSSGVDARLWLTGRLSVVADLTIGFMPNKRFYRRSTNETLLLTPTMDLAGMLGLVVTI